MTIPYCINSGSLDPGTYYALQWDHHHHHNNNNNNHNHNHNNNHNNNHNHNHNNDSTKNNPFDITYESQWKNKTWSTPHVCFQMFLLTIFTKTHISLAGNLFFAHQSPQHLALQTNSCTSSPQSKRWIPWGIGSLDKKSARYRYLCSMFNLKYLQLLDQHLKNFPKKNNGKVRKVKKNPLSPRVVKNRKVWSQFPRIGRNLILHRVKNVECLRSRGMCFHWMQPPEVFSWHEHSWVLDRIFLLGQGILSMLPNYMYKWRSINDFIIYIYINLQIKIHYVIIQYIQFITVCQIYRPRNISRSAAVKGKTIFAMVGPKSPTVTTVGPVACCQWVPLAQAAMALP